MFDDLKPHLFELRKRLAISAISVVIAFFVMFYFHEFLLEWMIQPLNDALAEVGKAHDLHVIGRQASRAQECLQGHP